MAYTEEELWWAAGFLEGEGCFSRDDCHRVAATQTATREPLDKLMRIFGGSIRRIDNSARRARSTMKIQDQWLWRVSGEQALFCMLILLEKMSVRRQEQIYKAMNDINFAKINVKKDQ